MVKLMASKKENRIQLIVDEKTKEKLNKLMAAAPYKNQSKIIRDAINDCVIEDIEGKAEIIRQLKKIGTNVNQIAKAINSGDHPESLKILDALDKITSELQRIGRRYS